MSIIKLLVTDLDKTLLNDQNKIGEYSVSVLKKARRQGIRICFASGRHEQMMKLYVQIVGGVDYVISSNGAMARGISTGRILAHDVFPQKALLSILDFLQRKNMSFVLYSAECAYYRQPRVIITRGMEAYERLADSEHIQTTVLRKEIDLSSTAEWIHNIVKAVVYEDRPDFMDEMREYVSCLDELCMENTGKTMLGIFKKGVSKKSALEKIMEDLGIEKENVAAFGDYENDLSMFECTANMKVAVDNAVDTLKNNADYITESNNEEGVARFIDRMIL